MLQSLELEVEVMMSSHFEHHHGGVTVPCQSRRGVASYEFSYNEIIRSSIA
jgi:hypothetical protein